MSVRFLLLLCLGIPATSAALAGREGLSMEGLCQGHPDRVRALFGSLDLGLKGMGRVRAAAAKEDWPAACRSLVAYYRSGTTAAWLRRPAVPASPKTDPRGEEILKDRLTFYTMTHRVGRLKTGGLNWHPTNDIEWNSALHRHGHLGQLLAAYRRTGNRSYVRALARDISDWVLSNPRAGKSARMAWYGLEPGLRLPTWARIFYGLQQVEEFTPAARILMLTSIPDHGHFLRHRHGRTSSNWITMQMLGLACAGLCWPEFKDAGKWHDYASRTMSKGLAAQVYPDGVQIELTSHYHRVALSRFQRLAELAEKAGRPVARQYNRGLEKMWNYLAYSVRPDGYGVLNNDSDRDNSRPAILKYAARFARPDWTYIASNGRKGRKPAKGPSVVFPYAGQVIMRSGWDADAHWAFFDVGPLGTAHQHHDKLHLSVAAFGRDILVDSGRYTYTNRKWRQHFRGSEAHNVILVDGRGQGPDIKRRHKPMAGNYAIRAEFDFARGRFDRGFRGIEEKVTHTRAVFYLRRRYWVVVDRISLTGPHGIRALWHYHPDCTVEVAGASVASVDPGKGNLRIIPISPFAWGVKVVKGRTKPPQGWWSGRYGWKVPSPCAVYSARLDKTTTFAWLMLPARGVPPRAAASITGQDDGTVRLRVELPGEEPIRITVPLKEGRPGIS